MSTQRIPETDLHAWLDGQLPVEDQAEVAAYLAGHPEEQARLDAYRQHKQQIQTLFDPVIHEPVPEHLRRRPAPDVVATPVSRAARPRWFLQLAAGLAIAVVSSSLGWFLHGQALTQPALLSDAGDASGFVHQAVLAHAVFTPEVKHPVEVSADQEAQLVKWLSKRIGSPIHAPRLSAHGFDLMGGRLLPGETGPVAQFMYQDSSGQRLTLYVTKGQSANRDTGFRFLKEGKVSVFYWIDGPFGYALSGNLDRADLSRICNTVYEQLSQT